MNRILDFLSRAGSRLGKGEAFTILVAVAITYLFVIGLKRIEPVAVYIAGIVTAYIGGGAAKVWADTKMINGGPKP